MCRAIADVPVHGEVPPGVVYEGVQRSSQSFWSDVLMWLATIPAAPVAFWGFTLDYPWSVLVCGLAFVVWLLGVLFLSRWQVRLGWRHWKSHLLKHEYCPSCGYGLGDAPVQDDGCRICSECGAAWSAGHRD
jgi:hypothetical protein